MVLGTQKDALKRSASQTKTNNMPPGMSRHHPSSCSHHESQYAVESTDLSEFSDVLTISQLESKRTGTSPVLSCPTIGQQVRACPRELSKGPPLFLDALGLSDSPMCDQQCVVHLNSWHNCWLINWNGTLGPD